MVWNILENFSFILLVASEEKIFDILISFCELNDSNTDDSFTELVFSVHYENTPIQIYWKFYHPKKVFR